MRNTPTSQEIEHCMELTGMDYIQARNHLIARDLAAERAREERAQAIRRALGPEMPQRVEPTNEQIMRALRAKAG